MPCVTLQGLIQSAYGAFADGATIHTQPMEGAPGWAQSEYYSLLAKAEGPPRTEMLAGPMLQAFLEERFQLKAHRETREMPVYALTVGKSGLKTPPLAEGACTPIDLSHPPPPPVPGQPPPNLCGLMIIGTDPKRTIRMEVRGVNMTQFAQRLSARVDRMVVDKTGIAGKYNFHLEFTPDTGARDLPGRGGDAGKAGIGGDPLSSADPAAPATVIPSMFQTSSMRRSRPTACAARDRVCSVTEALRGSRRRSSAARLVFMRRAISTLLILSFSIAC